MKKDIYEMPAVNAAMQGLFILIAKNNFLCGYHMTVCHLMLSGVVIAAIEK